MSGHLSKQIYIPRQLAGTLGARLAEHPAQTWCNAKASRVNPHIDLSYRKGSSTLLRMVKNRGIEPRALQNLDHLDLEPSKPLNITE